MKGERSAALLVRVWLEEGTHEFRARVTAVADPSSPEGHEPTITAVATRADLLEALRGWLEVFVDEGGAVD